MTGQAQHFARLCGRIQVCVDFRYAQTNAIAFPVQTVNALVV